MVTITARHAVDILLRGYFSPLLEPRGFIRRGRVYRLASPTSNYAIVDIQRSSGSWREEYIFYVNVGVAPEPWLDYYLHQGLLRRSDMLPGIEHTALFARLDPPVGSRWTIDASEESVNTVGPQIVSRLRPKVEEAEQLLGSDVLLDRAKSGELLGWITDNAALVVTLLAAKGQSDELTDMLDNQTWDPEFETWARERAERSSLP